MQIKNGAVEEKIDGKENNKLNLKRKVEVHLLSIQSWKALNFLNCMLMQCDFRRGSKTRGPDCYRSVSRHG